MDGNTLNAAPRSPDGKGPARQLRLNGRIPGVFYYRSELNIPFSVDQMELTKMLRNKPPLIDLHIEGQEARECVIRDIQRDPVDETIIHFDLMGIKRGQKLTVTVPIRLIGLPAGVKTGGGILQSAMKVFEIECLPKDIPTELQVEVSDLQIGQSRHIRDLSYPDIRLLDDPDELVATVVPPTIIREAAPKEEVEAAEEEGKEEAAEEESGEKE
jgi:large subunit ribosomal protein L25